MKSLRAYIDNTMRQLDEMDGDSFEEYMTHALSKIGYKYMHHTPMVNDHGLDAYGKTKNGTKIGFQFKRFNGKVSYNSIYETLGGGVYYNTTINVLLTNSFFTENAKKTCKTMNINSPKHPILLWNRYKLRNIIYKVVLYNYKKRKKENKKRRKLRAQYRISVHNKLLSRSKFVKEVINTFKILGYSIRPTNNKNPLDFIGSINNHTIVICFILRPQYQYIKDMDNPYYTKVTTKENINRVIGYIKHFSSKTYYANFIITNGLVINLKRKRMIASNKGLHIVIQDRNTINKILRSLIYTLDSFRKKIELFPSTIPSQIVTLQSDSNKRKNSQVKSIHNSSSFFNLKKYHYSKNARISPNLLSVNKKRLIIKSRSNNDVLDNMSSQHNKHIKDQKMNNIGNNLGKPNVYFNTRLLKYFDYEIYKFFIKNGYSIKKYHNKSLLNYEMSKDTSVIGIKIIHEISQLFEVSRQDINSVIKSITKELSYNIDKCIIITNGTFTQSMYRRVKRYNSHNKINIELYDCNLCNFHNLFLSSNSTHKTDFLVNRIPAVLV